MGLRDLIDHVTSGFGDQADITQKDVLDEDVRKAYPQYANLPDDVLAAAAAKNMPEQYSYLAKFDPTAPVAAAQVPRPMRTDQFYQRNPDLATQDAKDTLARIRQVTPAYANVPDHDLAAAAEANAPAQFAGLTAKLNAGEIEKARADARDKMLSVANGVASTLRSALSNTAAVPEVKAIREGFNKIIAPQIDKIKQDTINYYAPSEDEIVKHTQETGDIPYAKILKRTAISTAVDQIPSKLEDFASFFVLPEVGKVAGAAVEEVAPGVMKALTKERSVVSGLRDAFPHLADTVDTLFAKKGSALNPEIMNPDANVPRGTEAGTGAETTTGQPEPARPGLISPPVVQTPPPVERAAFKLTPDQQVVEADAIKALQENYPKMAADYRQRFGKTLNVDDARKLFPAYEATPESRSLNAPAVHEPASALTKGIYEQMLHEPDPSGNNTVLFMAGGGGSGKTSFLRYNPEMKSVLDNAQIVVDGTMANPRSAAAKIDAALGADKNVQIVTVYRPPEEAFAHALERAQNTGRTVHLDEFAKAHRQYPDSIRNLMEKYKSDPRVNFHFVDNSLGAGKATVAGVDVLSKTGYTETDKLRSIADEAYRTGKISEAVYRGTTGQEPPLRQTADGGGSPKPEQNGVVGPATTADAPAPTPGLAAQYDTSGNALSVPVSDIATSPERFQPRKSLIESRVQTLSENMREKGFQASKPIIAWKDLADSKLYVLAGHHRLEAARRAGLDKIPTVIEPGSEADAIALARRSNSTRAAMGPVEEAKAYKAEADAGASYGDISKNYGGVKTSEIQRKLKLNNLPPTLQDLVDSGQFSVNHAVELGGAAEKYGLSPTVQQQIFNEVVKKMDVTPATFRTMLDTLGPAAAKQVDMGLDFSIDQGILSPLRELAKKTAVLEKARRQLHGYMTYIDNAADNGEKITAAQIAVRTQAGKAVTKLEGEIAQLKKSVGQAAKPSVATMRRAAKPAPSLDELFPQPASAETGAVKLGPDSPNIDLGNGKIATFKREMYDRFEPIKYKEGEKISPEHPQAGGNYTESYVAARELKGKIRARGSELLNELNDIVQPLENNADRQVLNKIYSLRNFAELDELGKTTSGVTAKIANEALAKLRDEIGADRFNKIATVADQVADLQNNKGLDVLVEGKVITPEAAQILKDRYPHYLRSEILDEQLSADRPEFKSADNGEPIGKINKSFLKTKGGTKKLINTDVLDVVRRSLVTKVASAEKQQVVDQIVKQFGTEIGGQVFKDGSLVKTVDPKKVPPGYVESTVKASGGKIYALRKDVENLLQGLNRHEMDMITHSIGAYNRLFKAGATTYRAPFVLSNLFRDAQELFFKGRHVPGQANRVVSYARALLSSVKEAAGIPDATFEAWQRGGGAYGGIVTSIPEEVKLPFKLMEPKAKMAEAAKRAMMIPFQAVSIPAEILENTSRLAEYMRLKPTDLPESLKVLNSRDITVDFEKMGDAMKVFNTYIPFLNPGVQGGVNILRAMKDQPAVSAAKLAAYIAVPTIALYAWNRKFSNDDTVDPYIKDNFWYINTGQTTMKDGKRVPILITIRKGETAQFFSYPIQSLLEFAHHDKNFQNHLADWNPGGIARGAASSMLPPLMKEPLEQAANYDFFRQGPIIPKRLEDVRPGFQFTRGTTNTARALGEKTGISPIRMEHALYGIWPASRQVLQLMDTVFAPKPTFAQKPRDVLARIGDVVPVVRTPSGYFSQDEQAARTFDVQYRQDKRTPAFLFREAMSRYAESRSPDDLAAAKTFAAQLPATQRQAIVTAVRREIAQNSLPPQSRALARMNRSERRAYARDLQDQSK